MPVKNNTERNDARDGMLVQLQVPPSVERSTLWSVKALTGDSGLGDAVPQGRGIAGAAQSVGETDQLALLICFVRDNGLNSSPQQAEARRWPVDQVPAGNAS